MCMSPHEMTSARIEEIIAYHERQYAADPNGTYAGWHQRKADNFREVLKERADNGTYATAGVIDNAHQRRLNW